MERILSLCRQMLAGDLDLVEGCSAICFARAGLPAALLDSPLLMPFVAFESDLHSFPIGESRKYWNTRALEEHDRRLAAIVEKARPGLLDSCRALLTTWGEAISASERKAILGDEWDGELRAAVLQVLSDLQLTQSAGSWAVGGSQEVETLTAASGGRSVTLTAETYVGLSVSGDPGLVEEIENRIRRKMNRGRA